MRTPRYPGAWEEVLGGWLGSLMLPLRLGTVGQGQGEVSCPE